MSWSSFSLIDSAICFDAPLRLDLLRSPRLAESAAPAAICCFFDFAGMSGFRAARLERSSSTRELNAHAAHPRRSFDMEPASHEIHFLPDGGWCPNNPLFPLVIYRRALDGEGETLAERFEELFARHDWPPAWRYTIFDYAHYHSTSHEVIGVYRGEASVRLGDAAGFTTRLHVGDVLLIPAGVSHERLQSSEDFHGVGAYPKGCDVDEQRRERNDREDSVRRIAALPIPERDPVSGESLRKIWGATQGTH